jgi:cytochrome c-type biogenesis protein CcsB
MRREVLYNRVRPAVLCGWLLAAASLLLGLEGRIRLLPLRWVARALLAGGFGLMTWGLAVRWQIAGRVPAANLYESLLLLGWGLALVALLSAPFRGRLLALNATGVAAATLVAVPLLPLDPFVHPIPPVLGGTPWLGIHVPLTMLSYALFALATVAAHLRLLLEIPKAERGGLRASLDQLLYWYLQAGSLFLAAGLVTGSVWAASSWGRYWGWDPKEVWSLVALLAYMAILHARADRWIGPLGVAAWSIVAFGTVLMTYLGVNFVLTAGLHSYGFGEGGMGRWLVIGAAAEAGFLMFVFSARQPRPAGAPAG